MAVFSSSKTLERGTQTGIAQRTRQIPRVFDAPAQFLADARQLFAEHRIEDAGTSNIGFH